MYVRVRKTCFLLFGKKYCLKFKIELNIYKSKTLEFVTYT